MRGATHSYFISRTPTLLEFEEFIYLYTALEGCHYVHAVVNSCGTRVGANRTLCRALGPAKENNYALEPPKG
jgi:hypothetical protein